jgi:cytochrome P450
VKRGKDFVDRPVINRVNILCDGSINSINQRDIAKWKWMRKFLFKGLKLHNLKRIEIITQEIIQDVMKHVKRLDGQPFDPTDMIHDAVLQILTVMVLSRKVETSHPSFKKLKEMDKVATEVFSITGPGALLDVFPWLRYFGNKTYKNVKKIRSLLQEIYKFWKGQFQSGECDDDHGWFTQLLDAIDNNPVNLSEGHMMMLFFDFFFAGSVTTSATLSCFLNVIVHYPDIQENLQKEVDSVIERNCSVAIKDRDSMPYTYAFILELLR